MFESYQQLEHSRQFSTPARSALIASLAFAFLLGALFGILLILVVREHRILRADDLLDNGLQLTVAILILIRSVRIVWQYLPPKQT